MSYVPTNVTAYVAAYSGAIAGMAVNGWITESNAMNYADPAAVAGAFAQAFDLVWDDATELNLLQLQTIIEVCHADLAQRAPGPSDGATFLLPGNWEIAAAACVAVIQAANAFFAAEGIVPPPAGGGGGASVVIQRVRYVSPSAGDSPNGAASNPFPNFEDAIASFTSDELNAGVLLYVGPGDYQALPDLDLPATPLFSIVGIADVTYPPQVLLPSLASVGGDLFNLERVQIESIDLGTNITTPGFTGYCVLVLGDIEMNGGDVTLSGEGNFYNDASQGNIVGAGSVTVYNTLQGQSDITCTGQAQLNNTVVLGDCDVGALIAKNTEFQGATVEAVGTIRVEGLGNQFASALVAQAAAVFRNVELAAAMHTSDTSITMYGCNINTAMVVTFTGSAGVITQDAITNASWVSSGASVVNGTVNVL